MTKQLAKKKPASNAETTDEVDGVTVEEAPDDELVEQAVADIRGILKATYVQGMVAVGEYLLKTFYDDDPDLYLSKSPTKGASLSSLLRRADDIDLSVRRTFLSDGLRIAAYDRKLPAKSAFKQLPASHRVALTRLGDPTRVEKFAEATLKRQLSVVEVRELVSKQLDRAAEGEVRRTRASLVVRQLDRFASFLRNDRGRLDAAVRDRASRLSDDQRKQARETIDSIRKRLSELEVVLGRADADGD